MKKAAAILGGVLFGLLCGFSVSADVVWEPEDSFYWEHASECNYENRRYTANGPDGVVIVYKSPENPEIVEQWENGHQASIVFTYREGGIEWGVYDNYKGTTGWVPMDYMKVVYDYISFEQDYGAEFQWEGGELDKAYLDTEIYFWEYPGAEEYTPITARDHMPEYGDVFVDEAGNRWGNVSYYYGMKNGWVCIDRPNAALEELYPDGVPARDKSAAGNLDSEWGGDADFREGNDTGRIVPKRSSRTMAVTMALVLLVTAVTALLLMILRKGRRWRKDSEEGE